MLASVPINLARDTMLGFDTRFLPDDTELIRRLNEEERRLIDELIRFDRMEMVFPGDANAAVSVAVWAASYTYPAAAWRIRQVRVNYVAGQPLVARIIPSNNRHNVPVHHPSLYIQGADFYPIDGGTSLLTRIYGWGDASEVEFDYVTEPTALTAGTSTLNSPDEASTYLAMKLAHYMATRAKVADATMREIKEQLKDERTRLFQRWDTGLAADQVG